MIDEITRALNGKSDNVDLKAEKIELGIIQDIDKLNSKLKGDLKSILSLQSDALKERSKAFSIIRKAYDDAKKAQDSLIGKLAQFENASLEAEILFNNAKKASKELGVEYTDVKGVNDLQKTVSIFDENVKDVKVDVTGIIYNIPNI